MPPPSNDLPARLAEAIDDAQFAFWDHIASQFPEITTGDLSPETTFAFGQLATDAVVEWFCGNQPNPPAKQPLREQVDSLRHG